MARINLLTLHYADNNGSALQAYATCKILRNLGHEVTVINLQNRRTVHGRYKKLRNWTSIPRYFNFWRFQHRYLSPMTKRMFDINVAQIPKCDFTIVGSDQVWNSDFGVVKKGSYFLNFVNDGSHKISLASSFGKKEWKASKDFTEQVKGWLADFKALSVRERSGVDICEQTFSMDAVHVLDPTLALADYSELLDMTPRSSDEIRCFLFKKDYSIDVIDYVSKSEKLPVRKVNSIKKDSYIRSPYWRSSPIKWMAMIRDARIWVSDSFHGIAFAIIFKKQFIALVNDIEKLERVNSLLTLLGLESKLVYSLDDLKTRYSEIMAPIDYDSVFRVLKIQQVKFISFITDNIR